LGVERDLSPIGEGSGEGLSPYPEKNVFLLEMVFLCILSGIFVRGLARKC